MDMINYLRGKPGLTGFGSASTAEDVTQGVDLTGKVAIVTGGGSGLGEETARVLALRGAHVFIAVRRDTVATMAKEKILVSNPNAKIDMLCLDLASFKSVRQAAKTFLALNLPVHILVNNAAVMACPFSLSEDGHELQFATNHLGHFLFTKLLLEKMKATAKDCGEEGRIVFVSSIGHNLTYANGIRFDHLDDKEGYSAWPSYGQSKLANILCAKELSRQLQAEGASVVVNALHPGGIRTPLQRHMSDALIKVIYYPTSALWKSVPQGAATSCLLAASPKVKGVTGKYFSDCNETQGSKHANDMDLAARLWDYSTRTTSVEADEQTT